MAGTAHPRRERAERACWLLAAVPAFWSFSYGITRGSDFWWHLAAGRWTVEHGAIPRVDPFSFTAAGREWLNDAWLSDVIFSLWVSEWGLYSLAWWKWALVIGAFLLLLATLMRVYEVDGLAGFLACLLALATAAPFLDMRPQLYSCLGFVMVLALGFGRSRAWWGLPFVFVVWVNLHAGVLLGLLCLPILLAPSLLGSDRALRHQALGVIGLSFGACLLNPSGLAVFSRPLRYALDPTSPFRTIGEWQPPFRPGGIQAPVFPYLIGACALAVLVLVMVPWLSGGWRRLRALRSPVVVALALGTLTLVMSLRSRRFIPFFAVVSTCALAPALHQLLAPLRSRVPRFVMPAIACLVGIIWLAPYPRASYAFHYLTAEGTFPIDTGNFIQANKLSGDIFAYYNWGGYLHHRTAGRLRVYIDGRAGAVFDDETYRRYVRVLSRGPGWIDVVEGSGARYVLWPRHYRPLLTALIGTGRWRPIYEDAVSMLLVRADQVPTTALVPSPQSPYRDLGAGLHRLERGKFEEAIPYFERARAGAPHMGLACELMAKARAGAEGVAAGRATLDECRRLFPLARLVPQFESFVRRLPRR